MVAHRPGAWGRIRQWCAMDPTADTVEVPRVAADTRGYPVLRRWATRVAEDPEVLAWLGRLPPTQAAAEHRLRRRTLARVPAPDPTTGCATPLLGDDGRIVATIRSRSTQTNEVGGWPRSSWPSR